MNTDRAINLFLSIFNYRTKRKQAELLQSRFPIFTVSTPFYIVCVFLHASSDRYLLGQTYIDEKRQIVAQDRTKTKSSYRTLPLVGPIENLLLAEKAKQQQNRRLCGTCYCTNYLDYIFVNDIGELIQPDFVSGHFALMIKKHGLRKLRFYDLRHSCASLLFANGVSMKEIQAWLGHSTLGTTANIYTHMDEDKKLDSANAIMPVLKF